MNFIKRWLKKVQEARKPKPEDLIAKGICPTCLVSDLHAGPKGGASTNFACFNCLTRYNAAFSPFGIMFLETTGKIQEYEKRFFRAEYLQWDAQYLMG